MFSVNIIKLILFMGTARLIHTNFDYHSGERGIFSFSADEVS